MREKRAPRSADGQRGTGALGKKRLRPNGESGRHFREFRVGVGSKGCNGSKAIDDDEGKSSHRMLDELFGDGRDHF